MFQLFSLFVTTNSDCGGSSGVVCPVNVSKTILVVPFVVNERVWHWCLFQLLSHQFLRFWPSSLFPAKIRWVYQAKHKHTYFSFSPGVFGQQLTYVCFSVCLTIPNVRLLIRVFVFVRCCRFSGRLVSRLISLRFVEPTV